MSSNNEITTTKNHWVWTEKAEKSNINPKRTKAGEPIWSDRSDNPPITWIRDGLIKDASENKEDHEGQMDLFDFL